MIRLRPGALAPDVVLRGPDGVVRSTEFWRMGPAVVSFNRHFGCPFGKAALADLRREHPRIAEARGSVAAVFMGTPRAVGRWCQERDMPFECLADPERSAYRAFGLTNGSWPTWMGPRVIGRQASLFRRGVAVGLPYPGQDIRQLGGTFVVAKGGRVRLAHYAKDATDVLAIDPILGALGVG